MNQIVAIPRPLSPTGSSPVSISSPAYERLDGAPVALTVALRYLASRRALRRARSVVRVDD